MQDLELENLELDNKRIRSDLMRIDKETEKFKLEIECLVLKKSLLLMEVEKAAQDERHLNILNY